MMDEEKNEQVIGMITEMLREYGFSFEYLVRKNPKGIKIICEVTQEQMNEIMSRSRK